MTYEVQFALPNDQTELNRFVNIDIDKLVAKPAFQKNQGAQQSFLEILNQEIKQIGVVDLRQLEKDFADLTPEKTKYSQSLQNAIANLRSQNKRSLTRLASVQYFFDQCQQFGIALKGIFYDELVEILQKQAENSS